MNQGICKNCGGSFWETSKGARGEDICDRCDELRESRLTFKIGQAVHVDGRAAVVRNIDGHGVHVEFCDCPEIGAWAHHPDDVSTLA